MPAGIRTRDLSFTRRMPFWLSYKSRSVLNGVPIQLSQLTILPSLTPHLLPHTLHAWFGCIPTAIYHIPLQDGILIGNILSNKIANRYGAPRPPMADVGTETAFRLDQRKHFQKSKHPLRSEVS